MNDVPSLLLPEARWIWPETLHFNLRNSYAQFRKEVVLTEVPATAPTLVTADQSYRLYANGRYVCRGPARGYQKSWPYDEVDLAPYLRPGANLIAARCHNPGFSNFQYIFEGWAGFLFMGHWGDIRVVSDRTWKCRSQTGLSRDARPSSLQLFCQEHVDARIEPDDWMMPGFDDRAWIRPEESSAWNAMPWFALEPRGVPMLRETRIDPLRLIGQGGGVCAPGYETASDVVEPCRREPLAHPGRASYAKLVETAPTQDDSFSSYLLDFGKTVVGNLALDIQGAQGGEIVDAVFSETVDASGTAPRLDHKQVSLGSRLICRPGSNCHTFYHPYGFRYLMLRVRRAPVSLSIRPALEAIGYPFHIEGRFTSSDAGLNRIWAACAWTQQVCSLDAYVDTPWREQAQWWGDARVQAWNTFHLDNDDRLLKRGIDCIGRQTTPDGLTYGHAPTMAHNCVLPDFTLIWMLSLWDHYWQTGSPDVFLRQQDPLRRALDYFRAHTDPVSGLVGYDRRHWLFLDWTHVFRDGYPTILNLWLLIALRKMALLHRTAGREADARELQAWADRLAAALHTLATADGHLRDGLTWDRELVADCSIHSQTLAIVAGLAPHRDAHLVETSLLPFIRELRLPALQGEKPPAIKPSIYWLTYVFSVLDEAGFGRDVVDYIGHYWPKMAAHGTTWSQYGNYGGEQSHSHAWSAHPLYHLMQIVGGVRQIAPAWSKIAFRPLFHGEFGETTTPTPQGLIHASWRREKASIDVRLRLPAGVQAQVELPNLQVPVTREGRWSIPLAKPACAQVPGSALVYEVS